MLKIFGLMNKCGLLLVTQQTQGDLLIELHPDVAEVAVRVCLRDYLCLPVGLQEFHPRRLPG